MRYRYGEKDDILAEAVLQASRERRYGEYNADQIIIAAGCYMDIRCYEEAQTCLNYGLYSDGENINLLCVLIYLWARKGKYNRVFSTQPETIDKGLKCPMSICLKMAFWLSVVETELTDGDPEHRHNKVKAETLNDVVNGVRELINNESVETIADYCVDLSDLLRRAGDSDFALEIISNYGILCDENDVVSDLKDFMLDTLYSDKSKETLNDELDADPYNANNWLRLGNIYMVEGNDAKALDCFRYALTCEPDDIDIKCSYAAQLYKSGEYAEALGIFKELYNTQNIDVGALELMGSCCYMLGMLEKSCEIYNQVIDQEPDNDQAYYGLATSYEELKMLDDAMVCIDKSLEISPDNCIYQLRKADLFFDMEEYDLAEDLYKEILDKHPDNCEAHLDFADFLINVDDYSSALTHIEYVLTDKTRTDLDKVREMKAACLYCLGNVSNAAVELANVLVRDETGMITFYDYAPDAKNDKDFATKVDIMKKMLLKIE